MRQTIVFANECATKVAKGCKCCMKTVWTNGCLFLHRGHIEMFKFAKSLGDFLVVGLDTDEKLKHQRVTIGI